MPLNRRSFLAGGSAAVAALLAPAPAFAEKIYDASQRKWIEFDVRKMTQGRKTVPAKFKRRNVFLSTREKPGTIIIDTNKHYLYLVTGRGKATRYGIGVGKEGFEWNGRVTVKRKAEWPAWHPPAEMIARELKEYGRKLPKRMEGGPENPLGARALYLFEGNRDTLYRIHGTNQPWSIGLSLSSGCIRLLNKDVEHLYERVKIGSPVVVIGPGQSSAGIYSTNPLANLFGNG